MERATHVGAGLRYLGQKPSNDTLIGMFSKNRVEVSDTFHLGIHTNGHPPHTENHGSVCLVCYNDSEVLALVSKEYTSPTSV